MGISVQHSHLSSHCLYFNRSWAESTSSNVILVGFGGSFRISLRKKAKVVLDLEILYVTQPLWCFKFPVGSSHASINIPVIIPNHSRLFYWSYFWSSSAAAQASVPLGYFWWSHSRRLRVTAHQFNLPGNQSHCLRRLILLSGLSVIFLPRCFPPVSMLSQKNSGAFRPAISPNVCWTTCPSVLKSDI